MNVSPVDEDAIGYLNRLLSEGGQQEVGLCYVDADSKT